MPTINSSLFHSYIDKAEHEKGLLSPNLITNQKENKTCFKTSLLELLNGCSEYWINVAFLTQGGLAHIRGRLIELDNQGVKGKLIISSYQYFSEPDAIANLLKLKNAEIKLARKNNSHSKGYIVKNKSIYDIIIGSSNLTQSALLYNSEWNLHVSSMPNGDIVTQVLLEFQKAWDMAQEISPSILEEYRIQFENAKVIRPIVDESSVGYNKVIKPNSMQIEALKRLSLFRRQGKSRALLISATGTGKTYLSAFDVEQVKPKRVLFIVHRYSIAKKAMETFQSLFGNSVRMGLYSGSNRDEDADYVFSTIQTIGRVEHLQRFSRNSFDYIIIDETHRSGAESYQKIINYFEPQFLLGMTATPERTDGFDIFKLFDNNVAAEIRLSQAMDAGLLSDFHYYGISDFGLNDQNEIDFSEFNKLDYDFQAAKVIEKSTYFGVDSGPIRGLVFCSSLDNCYGLSNAFEKRGYKVKVIDGKTKQENRDSYYDRLESDANDRLDYLFAYDVLNEGIDIPKVNQIIMIRPTQSAIVFVQQLGRGLRKAKNKEFLTVLDFIGNYKENNFFIPMALFGDRSFNRDKLRKMMVSIDRYTPLNCTINFDVISKQRIFKSIDTASINAKKGLDTDYNYLKRKLGRPPFMMDFINEDERDPFAYVSKFKSFPTYLNNIDKDRVSDLSDLDFKILDYLGTEVNNGKRVIETYLLNYLIRNSECLNSQIIIEVSSKFAQINQYDLSSAVRNLNFNFNNKNYGIKENLVDLSQNKVVLSEFLKNRILGNSQFTAFLRDNIEYGLWSYKNQISNNVQYSGLHLYSKYSRKDFCRVANLETNIESVIYGYMLFDHCIPLFITLKKDLSISDSIQYEDYFIDENNFHWMSKHTRHLGSKDIQSFILNNYKQRRVLLFVQKSKIESDFYFLGPVEPLKGIESFTQTKIDDKDVVSVHWKLVHSCPKDLFEYFTANIKS